MARARNIKPGFFQNEDLVELPYEYRLLFIGLWTIADREGRLENRPKKIKMQLFPADDLDLSEALLGLAKKNLITLYSVDSDEYIQINNFLKHQHPHHKEADSVIPAPKDQGQTLDKPEASPSDSLNPITDSLNPSLSSEQSSKPPEDKTFIRLTLNDKTEFPITENQCAEWGELFPAVDVRQELREMKAWLDANPAKRKTAKGILRFVTSWLSREQDRGHPQLQSVSTPARKELTG